MEDHNYKDLAMVRLQRAEELLEEAKSLLNNDAYKSANNRAYYCVEKCMNALLAVKKVQAKTHNGCLKQFNILYILDGNGDFTTSDYSIASQMEHIRNASDYDDFYIANKEESAEQIKNAIYFYEKTKKYLLK